MFLLQQGLNSIKSFGHQLFLIFKNDKIFVKEKNGAHLTNVGNHVDNKIPGISDFKALIILQRYVLIKNARCGQKNMPQT